MKKILVNTSVMESKNGKQKKKLQKIAWNVGNKGDYMKEKFWQYILDNFTVDNDGRKIISNIIDWFWMASFDKEDTVNALLFLLDGIGIEKEEIEQFVNWD